MRRTRYPTKGGAGAIGILAGYHQSLILLTFFRAGVFELLRKPISAREISARTNWRCPELRACLDFLSATTDLVRCDTKRRYHTQYSVRHLRGLEFHVEKFAGAYGTIARHLDYILDSDKGIQKHRVDSRSLVRAFAATAAESRGVVTAFIAAARPKCLIDLGCGSGSLLVQLARVDPNFRGIGIDSIRGMCSLARQQVIRYSLQSRIQIRNMDARRVERLPDGDSLHAASLMNEMFRNGPSEAIDFLKRLKQRYTGRDLWLVDYYGKLGFDSDADLHTLMHDLVQILSGQGLPPRDIRQWRSIYRAASCQVREAHEFSDGGIDWFVHRLRL
jgi:SAM-dependent methyltransferase